MNDSLYQYILSIADNNLILGQRLGELCGHGPSLETDIACTNLSLDLLGQVRSYYQYAAKIAGDGRKEDDIAMLRSEREYLNVLLVEQPNEDFGYVMVRQFFFDAFHSVLLESSHPVYLQRRDFKKASGNLADLQRLRECLLIRCLARGGAARQPNPFPLCT